MVIKIPYAGRCKSGLECSRFEPKFVDDVGYGGRAVICRKEGNCKDQEHVKNTYDVVEELFSGVLKWK